MTSSRLEAARIRFALREAAERGLEAREPAEVVKRALQKLGDRVAVSWSGGRCSTATLRLALDLKPDVKVLYNNTGVEYPETVSFVKELASKWNLNLTVTKPKKSFWTCVEEYGFPQFRGKFRYKKQLGGSRLYSWSRGRPPCCYWLKEEPTKRYALQQSVLGLITGMRVAESRVRMFGIGRRGQSYRDETMRLWKIHPIAYWSTERLQAYLDENGIPCNPLYARGMERIGCAPCTGFVGWREQLQEQNERMYRVVMRLRGEPTLWEYQDPCLAATGR